jgi:uncharacterized membrane protein
VAVMGLDSNGKPYERFFSGLFRAENVEVSAKPDFDELAAGRSGKMVFTVRNIGAARTFNVTVTDAHQFVSAVEPKKLVLGTGESGTVVVDVSVPAGAAPGVEDDVVIVVASSAGPATSNSNVAHFSVGAR